MNKLQLVRYILDHDAELLNWYCHEAFTMPLPDDLTMTNVTTHGTGYWGDIADLIIEDGIKNGIITEDDLS